MPVFEVEGDDVHVRAELRQRLKHGVRIKCLPAKRVCNLFFQSAVPESKRPWRVFRSLVMLRVNPSHLRGAIHEVPELRLKVAVAVLALNEV